MTTIGADTCRRCGRGVLFLPLSGGTREAFDLGEFPIDNVDEIDRFVVRAHRGAAEPLNVDEPITTCLRRHRCKVDPPDAGPVIPTESLQPHRTPVVATRSDFQGLRQLRTNAELLRLPDTRPTAHPSGQPPLLPRHHPCSPDRTVPARRAPLRPVPPPARRPRQARGRRRRGRQHRTVRVLAGVSPRRASAAAHRTVTSVEAAGFFPKSRRSGRVVLRSDAKAIVDPDGQRAGQPTKILVAVDPGEFV